MSAETPKRSWTDDEMRLMAAEDHDKESAEELLAARGLPTPFNIICGDALAVLRTMPDDSVNCCVTSPPYYGLRDYGTAKWEGGDMDCGHKPNPYAPSQKLEGETASTLLASNGMYREVCPMCGAIRIDSQIGLERNPAEYIARLVGVFREVRRVLRSDGTLWVNIGDSYASGNRRDQVPDNKAAVGARAMRPYMSDGLKPKDLIGIPWMLAFALRADGWWLRQDIIWHKPNPMPESVKDRYTKAHEYVFLLTKSARYWWDAKSVAEKAISAGEDRGGGVKYSMNTTVPGSAVQNLTRMGATGETRNRRSVWTLATTPFSGARVLADYEGTDGKPYRRSEDCPIHGLLATPETLRTASCDVLRDHRRTRKERTVNHPDPTLFDESASIASTPTNTPDVDIETGGTLHSIPHSKTIGKFPGCPTCDELSESHTKSMDGSHGHRADSSDCSDQKCSDSAISHSRRTHKTDHAPETIPPCIACAETQARKPNTPASPEIGGRTYHNDENSTSVDSASGASCPSAQTTPRSEGIGIPCLNGNMAQCTCQMITSDHFAAFPLELPELCLKAGCPEGGVVLDCFCGAGTTGLACIKNGRRFLGIELNPAYVTMAYKRARKYHPLMIEAVLPLEPAEPPPEQLALGEST